MEIEPARIGKRSYRPGSEPVRRFAPRRAAAGAAPRRRRPLLSKLLVQLLRGLLLRHHGKLYTLSTRHTRLQKSLHRTQSAGLRNGRGGPVRGFWVAQLSFLVGDPSPSGKWESWRLSWRRRMYSRSSQSGCKWANNHSFQVGNLFPVSKISAGSGAEWVGEPISMRARRHVCISVPGVLAS